MAWVVVALVAMGGRVRSGREAVAVVAMGGRVRSGREAVAVVTERVREGKGAWSLVSSEAKVVQWSW